MSKPIPQSSSQLVYWRVEGSLLELTAVRPVAFFAWNAQTFSQRWLRRSYILLTAALRPVLYSIDRAFATRVVYSALRGTSRDRLDLLGEEYFDYKLKPYLKVEGVRQLQELVASGARVALVSQGLDHVMRPLARHLGVEYILANRMEFRDGIATGRLLDPVIRPRGIFARISSSGPDGARSVDVDQLAAIDVEIEVADAVCAGQLKRCDLRTSRIEHQEVMVQRNTVDRAGIFTGEGDQACAGAKEKPAMPAVRAAEALLAGHRDRPSWHGSAGSGAPWRGRSRRCN